jgi:hypothetical protein
VTPVVPPMWCSGTPAIGPMPRGTDDTATQTSQTERAPQTITDLARSWDALHQHREQSTTTPLLPGALGDLDPKSGPPLVAIWPCLLGARKCQGTTLPSSGAGPVNGCSPVRLVSD